MLVRTFSWPVHVHVDIIAHVVLQAMRLNIKPNGRYCYTGMPFGIASGPAEYQCRQHEFLDGLHRVINIADDICALGCGDSKWEADINHDKNLTSLLGKCSNHDL